MLRFPFDGDFPVSSPFGERIHPITGVVHFHTGTDFALPEGTPILAPSDGVITMMGEDTRNGIYLGMNSSPGGFLLSFGHLGEITATRGQHVEKGEKIALSGATGAVTGPSLHYRVRNSQGVDLDPISVTETNGAPVVLLAAAVAAGAALL